MADRKEERERLREARVEREQSQKRSQRTRLMVGYALAGLVGLVVLVGIVVLITSGGGGDEASGASHINQSSGSTNGIQPDQREGTAVPEAKMTNLKEAAKEAGCELKLRLKDEGNTHLPPNSPTPNYKTNPPTSGNHVEPPLQQADGAYSETPLELDMVHSLEHGRMAIQYSPDLPEKDQLELKGLYETLYGGTLLFPNAKMPYAVAATTWTNLMGCSEYKGAATLDAIRAFGDATWGKYGGEPVNGFGLLGPTPAEPQS